MNHPDQRASTAQLSVSVDELDHVLGPTHGQPVVLEYGDFECPSCAQAFPAIKILAARFDNRFRFVFRHFPIVEIHPHALLAAQAAEAAGAQGRFWEMYDLLFTHPRHLKNADLHGHARTLGLDLPRFIAELDDQVYLQRVQEHIASGRSSGVRNTPCFFVDGFLVDASFGVDHLASVIGSRSTHPTTRLPAP
jgi:protein-disulfide isomerase